MKVSALFVLALALFVSCGKKESKDGKNSGEGAKPMFAEYEFVSGSNPQSKKVKGIIRIEKVNEQTAKISVFTEGNTAQDVQEMSMEGMPTREQIGELTSNCSNIGGQFEELETGAGRLPSCFRKEDGGDQVWYGNVPFMMLKRIGKENIDGTTSDFVMTIKSYSW